MARFINCTGCHADISDDREECPHCHTKVVTALEAQAKFSNDENVNRLTQEVVKLERANDSYAEQVATLTRENTSLQSENTELRRQVGLLPPKER